MRFVDSLERFFQRLVEPIDQPVTDD